jgi:hypothetical protein
MKYQIFAILFVLFWALQVAAQSVVTDLNGFRLGQFREAPKNDLGNPMHADKYEDGFEYEIYLLKPDSSVYMIFEYAVDKTDVIWSIQISGKDSLMDIGFKGLKFGVDRAEVERVLGLPTEKFDLSEYGERWEYSNLNYSIELNPAGKLTSVKIKDNYSDLLPDVSKLPDVKSVIDMLTTVSNPQLASYLSPGIEIHNKEKLIFFKHKFEKEVINDVSKVFETIRVMGKGLDKLFQAKHKAYEEQMRVQEGQHMLHVIKILKPHPIKEIVFKYDNGKYVIWEIIGQ